jgi:Phosphoesterase family
MVRSVRTRVLAALVAVAVAVGLGVAAAGPGSAVITPAASSSSVAFVQGTTFDHSGSSTSLAVSLSQPVNAGDLLVGWFAQYDASGDVQVSDNVNGAWTRAPDSLQFGGTSGDIALYYLAGSKAAASGLTITVSASSGADFQGTVAEYSGVAAASPLGAMAVARGDSTAVNSGATTSVPAGQLVYAAELTGVSPGAVPTPGSSDGITYTERESTASGSAFEEDITSGAAGAQAGTATLSKSTDWYAVVATFTPAATTPTPTPTTTSPTPTPTATSPTPTPTPTTTSTGITKVLVIMDENESDIDVFPSSSNSTAAMPYLWSLAQEYGYATNWSDIGHPSLPNYLAIFAGSAEGDPDDCDPGPGCEWSGPTVMSQAIAAGGTAKIYEEGMTANCQTSNPGYYDVNHNPWPYYTDSADETECAADDVPSGTTGSGALLSDINSGNLPTVGLLKPDLANDTTDGTFATADNWLKSWVPLIQSGPDWKDGRLAIVITFDESDEGAGGENVPFVMIAPGVSGVVVSQALNHYALTRFLDEVAGASLLGNAGTEPDIAPLFGVKTGALSPPGPGRPPASGPPASDVGGLRQMRVPEVTALPVDN